MPALADFTATLPSLRALLRASRAPWVMLCMLSTAMVRHSYGQVLAIVCLRRRQRTRLHLGRPVVGPHWQMTCPRCI